MSYRLSIDRRNRHWLAYSAAVLIATIGFLLLQPGSLAQDAIYDAVAISAAAAPRPC